MRVAVCVWELFPNCIDTACTLASFATRVCAARDRRESPHAAGPTPRALSAEGRGLGPRAARPPDALRDPYQHHPYRICPRAHSLSHEST
eukprot:scaffold129790_cov75-Phaeocystis_antarctica.AAC.2